MSGHPATMDPRESANREQPHLVVAPRRANRQTIAALAENIFLIVSLAARHFVSKHSARKV